MNKINSIDFKNYAEGTGSVMDGMEGFGKFLSSIRGSRIEKVCAKLIDKHDKEILAVVGICTIGIVGTFCWVANKVECIKWRGLEIVLCSRNKEVNAEVMC